VLLSVRWKSFRCSLSRQGPPTYSGPCMALPTCTTGFRRQVAGANCVLELSAHRPKMGVTHFRPPLPQIDFTTARRSPIGTALALGRCPTESGMDPEAPSAGDSTPVEPAEPSRRRNSPAPRHTCRRPHRVKHTSPGDPPSHPPVAPKTHKRDYREHRSFGGLRTFLSQPFTRSPLIGASPGPSSHLVSMVLLHCYHGPMEGASARGRRTPRHITRLGLLLSFPRVLHRRQEGCSRVLLLLLLLYPKEAPELRSPLHPASPVTGAWVG
jgi:hypothetical protein